MWYLPQLPVAIDGRNDLYGDDLDKIFYDSQSRCLPIQQIPIWTKLAWLFWNQSYLSPRFYVDPRFRLVYHDDIATVFGRRAPKLPGVLSAPVTATKDFTQSASRLRYWVPRIAVAVVVPLLLLAIVESALHLFNVGYSTRLMEPCTVHGQPYSCYNLFFAAPFFPPGVIKTPQFYTIPREKAPGTYRIFVFGESAAEGDPDFAYGFARYLEVMLRDRFPKQKFEIVNTGMVAINSNVTRLIARDLAAYQPDFYLVYAGSNEVVGPDGPGTVLTSSLIQSANDPREHFCPLHTSWPVAQFNGCTAFRVAGDGNVSQRTGARQLPSTWPRLR